MSVKYLLKIDGHAFQTVGELPRVQDHMIVEFPTEDKPIKGVVTKIVHNIHVYEQPTTTGTIADDHVMPVVHVAVLRNS